MTIVACPGAIASKGVRAQDSVQIVLSEVRGAHQILLAFDRLRRNLATAMTGCEGLFAGYDHLDFASTVTDLEDELIVTASAVAWQTEPSVRLRLKVDYSAERARAGTSDAAAAGRSVIAHGSGLTLLPA